ncbi:hypothetical protein [Streptomyces hydrogenans]
MATPEQIAEQQRRVDQANADAARATEQTARLTGRGTWYPTGGTQ